MQGATRWACIALLAACGRDARSAPDSRLVPVELQLAQTFRKRGIEVSMPGADTLFVRVPIGRDFLGHGPGRVSNLDSVSRIVARRALTVVDSMGGRPSTVVVALSRSRMIGPFVFAGRRTQQAYSAAELRQPPALSGTPPSSPIP